ncbi:unnamed protein product [Adineta steineri]|uniref:Ankyrin repeat protein n=1 Tax=Adineta steineri TaxID=433720 RepID=A0A813RVT6_9BILA|nr:unnamed protein product [Adineta steineri]CAF0892949.1 unnamed protein product [Adineta steineri]
MWSSMNSDENYLSEGPTKEQRILLSKTNRNDEKHLRKDSRGIEYIFSYIDRHHPHRKKRIYRLTWRTFIDSVIRSICQLSAAYLFGLSPQSIHSGLWGFNYNSVLTSQALGRMFFVLHGYKIWILTLYGSLMTLIVQTCISSFLNPVGWIFCLLNGSKKIIPVKIVSNLNGFIYEGSPDAIQCLISCGLNSNNSDYDGKNALHLAIITNHYGIVSFLIENSQVRFDLFDHSNQTLIDYVMNFSNSNKKNYLIDKIQNKYNSSNISSDILKPTYTRQKSYLKENLNPINLDEILFPSLF